MVSNNVLAVLVVIAIVISLVGIATTLNMLSQVPVLTGGVTGVTQATVAATITISLPVNTVNFGTMNVGDTDNTTDGSPESFVVQNDGSVRVNVTVNATQLWSGTGATGTSSYYQFLSAENESGSVVNTTQDLVANWTNMPISAAAVTLATRVGFTDAADAINAHIKVTVPSDEPAGAKSSTVTFTSVQA